MAVQQRRRTSVMLAFKVLQFVNQLRRRVRPRILQRSFTSTVLGSNPSPGPKQLGSISNVLAKTGVEEARPPPSASHGVRKSGRRKRPKSIRLLRSGSRNAAGEDVQQLLRNVDRKLSRAQHPFSTVAGDDSLFLKHNHVPIFEACSLAERIQLLAVVQDALHVLAECRREQGDGWLGAQGVKAGLRIDERFLANYEHMLLQLRAELIDAIARKLLDELWQGGHDKRQRRRLSWFSEFAEKPRPLSTSFPWTIKPSLAVLWGVCWMFYDHQPGEQTAKGGCGRVPLEKVLQSIKLDQWDAPASSDYVDLGRQLIGSPPQQAALHQARQQTGLGHDLFQDRNTELLHADSSGLYSRLPRQETSQLDGLGPCPVRMHPPAPSRDTYCRDAQQPLSTYSPQDFYWPHNQGLAAAPLTAFPNLGTADNPHAWHPYLSPQDSSRRHPDASPSNPSVTVTGTAGKQVYDAAPQTHFAPLDDLYQPEALSLSLGHSFNYNHPQYITSDPNMAPAAASMQIPYITVKHERTSSINSNGMPTPVSTSDPRSPLTPTVDARTHALARPRSLSRQISEDVSSLSGDDERRVNYALKRSQEPERNSEGKMVCTHQDCTGLFFERKCEWSKHMDKHNRPYKCTAKGCEKLQGFTYSGGLLRHEREVHKLHGGTKKSLYCPFHDCKRSSGSGFTRKENLAEHIRRVHRQTSMSADMHGLVIPRDAVMTTEASSVTESRRSSESPLCHAIEYRDDEKASLKRKRGSDSVGLTDSVTDEMRAEIKRLRQENEEKDSRLRQLEQAVMLLQQGRT